MPWEEFQCVVLGDEPAGLWLLEKLALPGGESGGGLAWMSLGEARPVCVPTELVAPFGITPAESWCAEILTPDRSLLWREDALRDLFGELPPNFHDPVSVRPVPKHSTRHWSAIRFAIRRHPELLAYASGLWKFLGRTGRLHPEAVVAATLNCTALGRWDAAAAIPETVKRLEIESPEEALEEVKVLKHGLSFKFRDRDPVISRRWVLNLPWHRLVSLARRCEGFWDILNADDPRAAPHALFALRMRVEAGTLPITARPLIIALDTDDIPDLEREVWPIEIDRSGGESVVTLWALAPSEVSLEAVLDRFRDGMVRLQRIFPFLDSGLLHLDLPLSMDTCFSDEERRVALSRIEGAMIGSYDLTSLQSSTRHGGLWMLTPSIHCHLPYPVGPLHGAQALYTAWTPKRAAAVTQAPTTSEGAGGISP